MDESILDGPCRECFELAWEAFCAGTIPVGAVVVDAGHRERTRSSSSWRTGST